ncbi:hypothetical protein EF847_00095 [Actinobacteria bacterium YIM 96077]|uniref:Uncharacterized protein n=1 Tax=Phytoactinopolyspora halophila TaxID=1981511 RepID=A0A329QQN9_9ACTN|nr:hypothetical protein [Phytoactinopolyspora halophila]AYY11356.1 hypothetical protein EF847_00095 [Actinobacteria bacterium YIM 96077]RAW14695.1 hypothetical protein DPM12_10575 [Phytoactinopolyspora halophila]
MSDLNELLDQHNEREQRQRAAADTARSDADDVADRMHRPLESDREREQRRERERERARLRELGVRLD